MLRNKSVNWPVFGLLVVIIAGLGYETRAVRSTVSVEPSITVTFDLARVFNESEYKKVRYAEIEKMLKDFNVEQEEGAKKINQMEADLEDHLQGSEKHRQMLEQWSLASFQFREDVEYHRNRVTREQARIMLDIYRRIKTAAEQLAVERGYDIILVDDSIADIELATPEEINRQITARRAVYTSPRVDVTDELISWLNQSTAGGSGS